MEQKSILIVEDDAIVAVHLRSMLTGLGYSVTGPLATGEAAIATAANEPSDLILMDIQLAGEMDGITAAKRILFNADVPIVFVTSYSQDPLIQQAKTIVPYGYLLKPVSPRELAVVIEMALNRHMLDRQLKAHEDALRKAKDEMELRVRERTADLLAINELLRREIEERGRIERWLQESEERYRRIAEGLTDYLFTVHVREGRAIEVVHYPASEVVTGYTHQEFKTDPDLWKRLVVAEDRAQVSDHIRRVLAGERVPPIEHRIMHKDGQVRWVSNALIPQLDSMGTLISYDGVIKDITERKQADERLFNSKATLTTVFDGISHPLIMLDETLRVKRLNRAAKDYYGLKNFGVNYGLVFTAWGIGGFALRFRTSRARMTMRCAAEYFGLQLVSVSVASGVFATTP